MPNKLVSITQPLDRLSQLSMASYHFRPDGIRLVLRKPWPFFPPLGPNLFLFSGGPPVDFFFVISQKENIVKDKRKGAAAL